MPPNKQPLPPSSRRVLGESSVITRDSRNKIVLREPRSNCDKPSLSNPSNQGPRSFHQSCVVAPHLMISPRMHEAMVPPAEKPCSPLQTCEQIEGPTNTSFVTPEDILAAISKGK